jgi:hypothetical protein
MKHQVAVGQTDYSVLVFIPDSASTDGSGKTGLTDADLTVSYVRVETDNDVTVTDVTSSLNDLSALTDAHADWGLKEVSSTLAPGLYRLDIADAVFASGAWSAVVYVMVTTSAAAASPMEFTLYTPLEVSSIATAVRTEMDSNSTQLAAIINVIGTAGDGLTAIPWNAAWDAEVQSECADALTAYDAATGTDVTTAAANVSVDEIQATALADLFNTNSATTYASAVAGSVVKEIADNAGGSALTEAGIADAVLDELLSGHTTAGSLGKAVADILVDTAEIGAAGAGLTNINLPDQTMNITGNITGNLSGSVGSVTAGVTVTTNNDKTGYTASTVSDKTGYSLSATGSAAMTESYAAAGSAPTIVQILYEIRALAAEKGISGTTLTTKKLDGSTTAATYTLDDATTPSAITRAT